MKPDADNEFEGELRQAFERRPAPPGMKRRLLERRAINRRRTFWARPTLLTWQRLAASFAIVAVLAGVMEWRILDQRRKEEMARQEVFTALRITSRALNQMNTQLAAHNRAAQD
jgi:anti-sigma-K factor RskA